MLPPPSTGGAAVITGASAGIGEEFAREFARRGYQLVLVARRADRLRAIAESLGGKTHVLPVDLSSPAERATVGDQVAALGLVAEIRVNNAGMSNLGPVAASDPEAELRLIEVDVSTGVTAGTLCLGPVRTRFGERMGIPDEEAEKSLPTFLWKEADSVAATADRRPQSPGPEDGYAHRPHEVGDVAGDHARLIQLKEVPGIFDDRDLTTVRQNLLDPVSVIRHRAQS